MQVCPGYSGGVRYGIAPYSLKRMLHLTFFYIRVRQKVKSAAIF